MRRTWVALMVATLSLAPLVGARGDDLVGGQQAARGLRTPPGFQSRPWASVPAPTSIEWAPDGSAMYVASLDGGVYRVPPAGGRAVRFTAEDLSRPLGLAIGPDGTIYASESYGAPDGEGGPERTWGRVVAFAPDGTGRQTVLEGLPNGRHNTNDLAFGPDGLLYVTNGNSTDDGVDCGPAVVPGQDTSCDVGERLPWSGSLLRIDASLRDQPKEAATVVATGMRNVYDVAFRPGTTEAWMPTNGPDSPAGDDVLYRIAIGPDPVPAGEADPGEGGDEPASAEPASAGEGEEAAAAPLHLGFPSCLYNAHPNDGVGEVGGHGEHGHGLEPTDNPNPAVIEQFGPCPVADVIRPVATFGGHVSANGLAFAHGSAFPGTYANDLFVAEWGNLWGAEDGHLAGHKVVRVNLRDDGTVVQADDHHAVSAVTEFATGGLPLDVAFGPDGALYVADMAGVIHRIAWTGGAGANSAEPPDDEAPGDDGHGHGGGHEYREVDCPGDTAAGHVLERREHHGNGRTECVLVDGDVVYFCGNARQDCYLAYDPYQQDTVEGNSPHDRGPAVRYHYNDLDAPDAHHGHGAGCWDSDPASALTLEEADAAGKAAIQRELAASLGRYTGDSGLSVAIADGWIPYPVPGAKQFHMIRRPRAGERHPDQPKAMWAPNVESFVIAMTDDGWQVMNGMFMLGNDGPENAPLTDVVHTPTGERTFYAAGEYDYKWIEDENLLPIWRDPAGTLVCDLAWHGHTGGEGLATSFDAEYPDVSPWMAHVGLYAAGGDPFGQERGYDASEPHAHWEPYRHVPAVCGPHGPCI